MMQLVAGRSTQEYNIKKHRKDSFWEDRYHAMAIETGEHLQQCLLYLDLNMVQAGAVKHPEEWSHGGSQEIQGKISGRKVLLLGVKEFAQKTQSALGVRGRKRNITEKDDVYVLLETEEGYGPVFGGKNEPIASKNALLWDVIPVKIVS